MKFKQIVVLDNINIQNDYVDKLKSYSQEPVKTFKDDPKNKQEIKERLAGADCVLLTWRSAIDKDIIEICKDLKFICLCGTNSNCIDLEECNKKGIVISNVKDYGDEGVVDWLFFQVIALLRGFGKYQWRDKPAELRGKTIGIIGLGAIGELLVNAALGFKMKVVYNSKTRKIEQERKGLIFMEKEELLQASDIISLQTPKNVKILDKNEFDLMQEKILINNTLGKAFDEGAFLEWIKKPNNYMIMDKPSDYGDKFKDLDRVIYSDFISGTTGESITRLSQKVLDNVVAYTKGEPISRVN